MRDWIERVGIRDWKGVVCPHPSIKGNPEEADFPDFKPIYIKFYSIFAHLTNSDCFDKFWHFDTFVPTDKSTISIEGRSKKRFIFGQSPKQRTPPTVGDPPTLRA